MAKAINWPAQFLDEILNEDMESPRIALRVGSLYFDNVYFAPDEIVDIRVDHKVVRKAQIIREMQLLKIDDLPDETLKMYKKSLQNKLGVVNFLKNNYNKPVEGITEVTVITYKNISGVINAEVDDPHL